ncbi:MAG: Nif3-like dinuclear metal center hexameric protein [Burkholderiaceae bacterium]|nr:Nif3-like dinuclear metal center hexameric protein [Burkholderiaceae bacterium]MDZ4163230.1 Nif3-like dinuclear metal center hexameric protein [Burkholderiales bacterium]
MAEFAPFQPMASPVGGIPCASVVAALDDCLTPSTFRDYGPNGLQVQGAEAVAHIVSGVTASLALIEAAIAAGADTLLVHHGLFWRGQDGRVTGWMRQRLKALLAHDINLLAYHLPLDAHPELGNNAQLARVLGLRPLAGPENGQVGGGDSGGPGARTSGHFGRFGEQQLGFLGRSPCTTLGELAQLAEQRLGRRITCVGESAQPLRTVAWCTGGAQSYFEPAMAEGASAFITGEISEPQAHLAREMGVGYLACGHHATERYGVQAVGEHLAATLGVRHTFIDIDNPA